MCVVVVFSVVVVTRGLGLPLLLMSCRCCTVRSLFCSDASAFHLTEASEDCVNAVTEVLRRFFRQLAEPLIPADLRAGFFQARKSSIRTTHSHSD